MCLSTWICWPVQFSSVSVAGKLIDQTAKLHFTGTERSNIINHWRNNQIEENINLIKWSTLFDKIVNLDKKLIFWPKYQFRPKYQYWPKYKFWPKYQFWSECQYLHLPHHLPFHALGMCFFLYQKEIYALKKVKPQNLSWAEWAVPFKSLHIINPLIMST